MTQASSSFDLELPTPKLNFEDYSFSSESSDDESFSDVSFAAGENPGSVTEPQADTQSTEVTDEVRLCASIPVETGQHGSASKSSLSAIPVLAKTLIIVAFALLFGLLLIAAALELTGTPYRRTGSILSAGQSMLSSPSPSAMPSEGPSSLPSSSPSSLPTSLPSVSPSAQPSSRPSVGPSTSPSSSPSQAPSSTPTASPSSSPSSIPSSSPTDTPIFFYVMGDVPYSYEETKNLKKQIRDIPGDAHFIAHVGDMNRVSETNCTYEHYSQVKYILQKSEQPIFIIPGDNDIKDCPNPYQARNNWVQNFRSFEDNWRHPFSVQRQSDRNENFAFFHYNVLFVGVDIVGSAEYYKASRSKMMEDGLDWALDRIKRYRDDMVGLVIFGHTHPGSKFKSFFKPLSKRVKSLGVPTLYIHGNGHEWEYEKKFFDVKNMIRVQVDRGGIAPPVRVKFRSDASKPFEFERDY